jgi:hypothetical protein
MCRTEIKTEKGGDFAVDFLEMALRTELAISYDETMRPVAARCTSCGDAMPQPDASLTDAAGIVLWYSKVFLEHKKVKHPNSQKITQDPLLP